MATKKILLPTDFSDNANHAIEYAIELFGFEDVKYILINAFVEPNTSADMLVSINDILQKQATADLNKIISRLVNNHPDIKGLLEHRLEYGPLATALKITTEKEHVDYVVMGTRGASGIKKALIGSNTSAVIRRVKCPIIAIPEKAEIKPLKNIALATDYEGLENDELLQPLVDITKRNSSKILAVNVSRELVLAGPNEYETKGMSLGKQFEGIKQSFFTVENPDVVQGVREFAKNHKVDMLVMISRKHTLFERLFSTSVTKEMSMIGEVPLMVLHSRNT